MEHVFGAIKSPCGNGDTHSPGFSYKNTVLGYVRTLGRVLGGIKKRRRQLAPATPRFYLFGNSFSVETKEQSGFPTPAKRVDKSDFQTENAITRLSRIRLTTIFKAEYITFRGASFWMGPEIRDKVNFEIETGISMFEQERTFFQPETISHIWKVWPEMGRRGSVWAENMWK